MDEYEIKYICEKCKQIFDGKVLIATDPDFENWHRGFICPTCHTIERNKRYWSSLS